MIYRNISCHVISIFRYITAYTSHSISNSIMYPTILNKSCYIQPYLISSSTVGITCLVIPDMFCFVILHSIPYILWYNLLLLYSAFPDILFIAIIFSISYSSRYTSAHLLYLGIPSIFISYLSIPSHDTSCLLCYTIPPCIRCFLCYALA